MARPLIVTVLLFVATFAIAQTDPLLDQATIAEQSGAYGEAVRLYHHFLSGASDTERRRSIQLRTSVLSEALRHGPDDALIPMLDALSARDRGDIEEARRQLQTIDSRYSNSYLHDDALYLSGYIALLDLFDFEAAHDAMHRLLTRYPESAYTDTALYSEAISLEQLGATDAARSKFVELRDRHTEWSIGFLNTYYPRGNLLSRYWFDRATRRLALLDERRNAAAELRSRRILQRGGELLRVGVRVDGVELTLLLMPSVATREAVLRDQSAAIIDLPETRLFSGRVEGDDQSWARVAITGESIEGVVQAFGSRFTLHSDALLGTIDYYQPRPSNDATPRSLLLDDYVMKPPDDGSLPVDATRLPGGVLDDGLFADRVARVAIVVDSQYNDYYGGNGLQRALSLFNVADGMYRSQFGLALQLAGAVLIEDRNSDPMNLGAASLEQGLRNFRDYRINAATAFADVSMVYLFSANPRTDETIGLAWIGAVCRTDGYDVGVTTPSPFGDLLLVHELGHSLGAQHDSDTVCRDNEYQLMWPRISTLTEPTFTQCSTASITPTLSFDCLDDAQDLALELALQGNELLATVRNLHPERSAEDARLLLDHTGVPIAGQVAQCVATGADELECRTGWLAPGGEFTFRILLPDTQMSAMTMLAQVSPMGSIDVVPDNNAMQISISPLSDGERSVTYTSAAAPQSIAANDEWVPPYASVSSSGTGGSASLGLLIPLLGGLFWIRRYGDR